MALAESVSLPSVNAGEYSNAINTAFKAASIESGLQKNLDLAAGISKEEAKHTGEKLMHTVTDTTPTTVFTAVGITYALGVRKQFKKSFKNPLFPNVTNTLEYSGKDGNRTSFKWSYTF